MRPRWPRSTRSAGLPMCTPSGAARARPRTTTSARASSGTRMCTRESPPVSRGAGSSCAHPIRSLSGVTPGLPVSRTRPQATGGHRRVQQGGRPGGQRAEPRALAWREQQGPLRAAFRYHADSNSGGVQEDSYRPHWAPCAREPRSGPRKARRRMGGPRHILRGARDTRPRYPSSRPPFN